MFYRLPPAGDPIELQSVSSRDEVLKEFFGEYAYRFYGSGTSALAAGLIAAIKANPKPNPEVLMPAYTCPALVSAALFAGAKPVLVDFEPDRPWMHLEDLQSKIGSQTVAVIAVHLFGIPERLPIIQEIAKSANLLLVEDSAQYLPEQGGAAWRGDFVILSFGRGKPASLLGGGAVLAKTSTLARALPLGEETKAMTVRAATFRARILLYNAFLSPRLYWLPASLPFLHLGETRFAPLPSVSAPGSFSANSVAGALDSYKRRPRHAQDMLSAVLVPFESRQLIDLAKACCGEHIPRLARYPLLVSDTAVRDRLFETLDSAGLGTSRMYQTTLPNIPSLQNILGMEVVAPNAQHFSGGVLTLPVHSGVTAAVVRKIHDILQKELLWDQERIGIA